MHLQTQYFLSSVSVLALLRFGANAIPTIEKRRSTVADEAGRQCGDVHTERAEPNVKGHMPNVFLVFVWNASVCFVLTLNNKTLFLR